MLTQERLRELLEYSPETGVFTWLISHCSVVAGQPAGTKNTNGYISISVDHKIYKAHRLAFLYMNGVLPKADVDHVNRIRFDNRWINLREATRRQNAVNKPSGAKSGVRGVYWQAGKWRAMIRENGKIKNLGLYHDIKEAGARFDAEAARLYGEFYRKK